MLILLSPSKTQDIDTLPPTELFTEPLFEEERWLLIRRLKTISPESITSLMKISKKLLDLHIARSNFWTKRHALKNSKQAIYTFTGAVYKDFLGQSFSKKEYAYMQKSIRILSGMYGVLRPLDLIQPYRLEMGVGFSFAHRNIEYKNLYEYWTQTVTQSFCKNKESVVINLASDEYSKVINRTVCNFNFVQVEFLQKKEAELKQVTIYSKQERGALACWMVKQGTKSVEEIEEYKQNGYKFSKTRSRDDKLVFIRKHPINS